MSVEDLEQMSPLERKKYMEEMKSDPKLTIVLEELERSSATRAKQSGDPCTVYKREVHMPYTAEMFLPYIAKSPTAQYHLQVFQNYTHGCMKLYEFGKQTIETEEDCDFLKDAFQSYAWAHMVETIMYEQFHPPPNTFTLLMEYLRRRPNDVFARYFKVAMVLHKSVPGVHKVIAFGEKIIEAELLVEDIKHLSSVKEERMVLISTYHLLGSMYMVTDQTDRALDSFQKGLDLDPTHLPSIYGVAISKNDHDDVDGAIKLLHKYLDIAPKCDKKYPNVLYQLGVCYFLKYKNPEEALKYYKRGLEAENQMLPFIEKSHADIPAKNLLETTSKLMKFK